MARSARFRVLGQLDMAGGYVPGTVAIDRDAATFEVRPYRRRKVYTLPLSVVATMVCQALVRAELREKLARRRKGKKMNPRRKP